MTDKSVWQFSVRTLAGGTLTFSGAADGNVDVTVQSGTIDKADKVGKASATISPVELRRLLRLVQAMA